MTGYLPNGLLALACAGFLANSQVMASADVVTLDWTIAETLIALDNPPVGLAEIPPYQRWAGAEALPEGVRDVGLRSQPNRELIAQQAPDHILLSPLFMRLSDQLEAIAPVTGLSTYQLGEPLWQRLQNTTHSLAELSGNQAAAATLVNDIETYLDQQKAQLEEQPPLLVVQFIDARHLRVFGEQSLFQAVIERLGLTNVWQQPTNQWGFSTAALEELLAYSEAAIVVVEPLPVGMQNGFSSNALWQHLPAVQENRVVRLPAVWSFGGLPSAARFAERLSEALLARQG
ncbi:ABC transporter substrate-binding protein [Halomonas sp. ISL-60]|uniref:ABC transporter substrate-binding protein n=1 Tax=Halomonas sp. ISL-56 TaxID=2819149 RepID=UPI001BEAFD13|nr:ABC transporter substrate-binding protein [Halomonas sp. ISL-56]MBT2773068.1 ABC transporter substrate-binding protein [Halomonas sp. ISL-60]MBT2800430.1 ABC transporter substrate-binding protein [Halomonas sp. ISL-56]